MKERLLLWVSIGLILVGIAGFFGLLEWPVCSEIDPETGLAIPDVHRSQL